MKVLSTLILYTLSLCASTTGEVSKLRRRNLLDLSRDECMVAGESMHCFPTNKCAAGWPCVPARDVDSRLWVGTYCYDPACISPTASTTAAPTPQPTAPPTQEPTAAPTQEPTDAPTEDAANRNGSTGAPGSGFDIDICWKEACGTNTVCDDGRSCLSKNNGCFCRDTSEYYSSCFPSSGAQDPSDEACDKVFVDDAWMTPTSTPTPPPNPPTGTTSGSSKSKTPKITTPVSSSGAGTSGFREGPVNTTNPVDFVDGQGFRDSEACWKEHCGTNKECSGGLSCMTMTMGSICKCRDPSSFNKDCTAVENGAALDSDDEICTLELDKDLVWVMSGPTDSTKPQGKKKDSKPKKNRRLVRSQPKKISNIFMD